MTIERMGPIDPVQKFNKSEKVERPTTSRPGDSISVSNEAKLHLELLQAAEQARSIPDIRQDRVAEVRARLEDPSYIDQRVVDIVADEVMKVFGID